MTQAEIEAAIDKLRYQVKLLGETINAKDHPTAALALEMDWDDGDFDKAHDIFETHEATINAGKKFSQGAFEKDFNDRLGIGYQSLKSVIIAFHRSGQWFPVVEAYIKSHGSNAPLELKGLLK